MIGKRKESITIKESQKPKTVNCIKCGSESEVIGENDAQTIYQCRKCEAKFVVVK